MMKSQIPLSVDQPLVGRLPDRRRDERYVRVGRLHQALPRRRPAGIIIIIIIISLLFQAEAHRQHTQTLKKRKER